MSVTMKVRINGESTDTTVENDSATWLCKLAQVRTSEGGGSFIRETNHATCTFTALIPLNLAPLVRTITVGIEGTYGTARDWLHDNGDGTQYRVVFHGVVVANSAKAIGTQAVQFTALSEMQGLFERRAHLAASNNSGPRTLCADLETAHSITINNRTTMIPASGDFYNLDRPKQKQASNGDMLRTVMGGTGMNIVGEWEGTMASPELCWRTDYPWFTGGNFQVNLPAGRPWEFEYPNVGTNFRDFVAKVEVNGEQGNTLDHVGWVRYPNLRNRGPRPSTRIIDVSNGTQYWGSAELGDAAERRKLAYQEVSVRSWIDTAAECENAAKWIMRHVGEPSYLKMNTIGYWPDRLVASAAGDADFTAADPDEYGFLLATCMLGDQFQHRFPFNDDSDPFGGVNAYGTWPDHCPVNGPEYDDLNALWNVHITNDGADSGAAQYYTIRSLDREWTPSGGWHIMPGLEADELVTVTDVDHGTY